MLDMVLPYKVTRTHRRLGLFPTKTVWETKLLLSDVHFADCPTDSAYRSYARRALLVVLEHSAPATIRGELKWNQVKIDMPNGKLVDV